MSLRHAWRHKELLAGPEGAGARGGGPRDAQEREAVGVFSVSLASLKRWLKWRREEGSATSKKKPGMRPRIGADAEGRRALWRQLEENPEVTLEEHREMWEKGRGARVLVATMSQAIRRLGWTYKQRRWRPPSATTRPAPLGAGG